MQDKLHNKYEISKGLSKNESTHQEEDTNLQIGMTKKSKCTKGRISIGGVTCQISEDEKNLKLANLSPTIFPSRNV